MNREILQRALDALMAVEYSMKQVGISVAAHGVFKQSAAVIAELRAALAAPVAPAGLVAWMDPETHLIIDAGSKAFRGMSADVFSVPLYAHPASIAPAAWLMDSGDDASWIEIGPQQPAPEDGFVAVPLYR